MRKLIGVFTAAAAVLGLTAVAAGIAGQQNDPLVSLQYFQETYLSSLIQKAQTQAKSALDTVWTQKQTAEQMSAGLSLKSVDAPAGAVISMSTGCEFSLISGKAAFTAGSAVDLTAGTEIADAPVTSHLYLIPEETASELEIQTDAALYLAGSYTLSLDNVREVQYTKYADGLYQLGLFLGTDQGYALNRKSTRIEGLVMLVRLMGEENAAKAFAGAHPFQDVPAWADRYVAYAYHKGYTKGSSDTTFGPSDIMTGNQYVTFLLRALGYDDSAGDFVWNSAVKTATSLGILSAADQTSILKSRYFYRDHIVYTSYKALLAKKKGGAITLASALVQQGVFTQSDWRRAQQIILG